MTWQRIDDDTYIDDTLVTCAEYQLFVDEMLGQGKYRQPDHWGSYRYQNGKAKEPVLGVRQSDAKWFCKWLNQHNKRDWSFRLPNQKENSLCPIKFIDEYSFGYWEDEVLKFAWIKPNLGNIRDIDLEHISQTERVTLINVDLAPAFNRALNRALNLDIFRYLDQSKSLMLDTLFDRDLNRIKAWDQKKNRLLDIERDERLDLDRFIVIDFTRNYLISELRTKAIELAAKFENQVRRDPLNNSKLVSERENALDIYFDLMTLQRRIAGESPAFEGIRLVKERIK